MDMELTTIQMVQDFSELAEEYDGAASNERLWALGAEDAETAQMHEENMEHALMMAKMYRKMAEHALGLAETYMED